MTERPPGFKVVIPARFGSTRLPGKPLLPIAGRPMIAHVVERARASAAEEVLVATDDPRIAAVCEPLGVEAIMTADTHRSGAERITEVIARRGWDDRVMIVNLQGDEPDMPSRLIDQVAAALATHPGIGMTTLACPLATRAQLFDPSIVKVVTDADGHALYFSRAPIPWHRDDFATDPLTGPLPTTARTLRHIGLYAYRAGFLKRYLDWSASPLELAESLEQLRVLWHGERIHVGIAVVPPAPGVDTAADLERVERAWRQGQHDARAPALAPGSDSDPRSPQP
ncbi:MAG: 3-deoxy-manno-octulosonate cytidylyltransferase [Sphingobacteriia bacterium]|nr:3-deoxy-manno-octulosonate cytidylyltransferase [Sphingobacteriia bacterium]NCC41091.1 3-deoxy-manno-octulosonate cytidylyltransferase [Gammaproteobacteria bacterium]